MLTGLHQVESYLAILFPSKFSLVLIGNKSDSNYINYDIQGYGVIMIDNKSIGTVFVQDKLEGAIVNYDFSN